MVKYFLLAFYIFSSNIQAQQLFQRIHQDSSSAFENNYENQAEKDDEVLKIMVEFTDLPSAKLPRAFRKSVSRNTRSSQFSSDLKAISDRFNTGKHKNSPQSITINKEFYKLFSGVQIDIPRNYIPFISGLDYVKKIHIDQQFSISLDQSVPLINADKVWSSLNNKGAGIKISIIDTGIDYFHQALGGGYGTGFKVIGGYDFANNDNDPIDDHGHGTHVAGITAANSFSLKGVAPEASLISCKVLDESGSGWGSWVIEGLEYSVDPNNDGDFSDAADVINMSLGASGTPDDPVSIAANNASDMGVAVCVAAGNSGSMGFFTVASPGCAEKVITVGHITKNKSLVSSSSKGPSKSNFKIKPDLVAPGSLIYSCSLSGGTVSMSGTSMASPHVAGICALIKKQHPNWSPEDIKSALKTTALKLNYEPMEQGSGMADALKAINTGTLISPADLSYGICDTTNAVWTTSRTLKIKNIYSSEQQYSLIFQSENPGISFAANQNSFSLSPGDSTEL